MAGDDDSDSTSWTTRLREGLDALPADVIPCVAPRVGRADDLADRLPTLTDPMTPFDGVLSDRITSLVVPPAVRAGLLLWNDEDDASHVAAQSREGELLCDHWHAIIHRREGDFGNARYWARRIERSPVFDQLPDVAEESARLLNVKKDVASLLTGSWDPFAFLDFVQNVAREPASDAATFARLVQHHEMRLLTLVSSAG